MLGPFAPGQSVRFSVTATLLGALANPPTVTLIIHGPDDTFLTPSVVNDSLGQYHADAVIPPTARPGPWAFRWQATGSGPNNFASVDTPFIVSAPLF